MKSCTEEVSPEVIQAVTHSTQVQDNGSSNWLTALTDDPYTDNTYIGFSCLREAINLSD